MAGEMGRRNAFLKKALERANLVLVSTSFVKNQFVSRGIPEEKIVVLPHGLDISWSKVLPRKQPADKVRIGYMGQIEPIKGVDLLVQAFRCLERGKAELYIYGDLNKNPLYTRHLFTLAKNNPAIRFMGPYDRTKLGQVLSTIDILVVPSIWYETFGLVIYEAFAGGVPVITSDIGAMKEAVRHDVDGLLFKVGDIHSLAEALQSVVNDPGHLQRLARGIRPVRTMEQEVTELMGLYEGLSVQRSASYRPGAIQRL